MSWILSYGCTSAAGPSTSALWSALRAGYCPEAPPPSTNLNVCEQLSQTLLSSWNEACEDLAPSARARVQDGTNVGVIFASTKGCIDDFIWKSPADVLLARDPLAPVLDSFLKASGLQPARRICVSNACTSGLSAVYLAEHWLKTSDLSDVIVLAADHAGDFVRRGFETLRVLTTDRTRPFSAQRSGFFLESASACVVLSRERENSALRILGVGVDAEGYAVTRPSESGAGLEAACRRLPLSTHDPDLIVAHGTATVLNDAAEDRAYARLFPARPLITGSKWCIGHTLGASSALDLIVAGECLRRGETFVLATTSEIDSSFSGHYAIGNEPSLIARRALVSSLGFGGIHAAALLERA